MSLNKEAKILLSTAALCVASSLLVAGAGIVDRSTLQIDPIVLEGQVLEEKAQEEKPVEISDPVASASAEIEAMPFDLGGPFSLIDHHGDPVTDKDFHGKHLMVFFGYANCPGICSAALPAMGAAIDAIEHASPEFAEQVQPVMITIAPDLDQPDLMRPVLEKIHPRLLGLTGSPEALEEIRNAYQVTIDYIGEDISGVPIYSHGSFIYLMGRNGKLQTMIPPILTPDQIATIVTSYLPS